MRVVSNTSRSTLWLLASCSAAQCKPGELNQQHVFSNPNSAVHLDELDVVWKNPDTQGSNEQLQTATALHDGCPRLTQTTLTSLMNLQQYERG